MGSSLGLTDENIQKYSDTSSELLFLYSIDWMMGDDTMESLEIETKPYSTTVLTVDNVKSKWIFAFFSHYLSAGHYRRRRRDLAQKASSVIGEDAGL